jgi:hypothetical protein
MLTLLQLLAAAAVSIAACGTALADSLTLHDGGRAEGTIDRIEVRVAGETRSLVVGDFQSVELRDGLDLVHLGDKRTLACQVLSVQIKTIGGVLTFPRAKIARIRVRETQVAATRREYVTRLAGLDETDLSAARDLMVWCDKRGLKAEANDLARRILDGRPNPVLALAAHKMLGHELVDGKWVARSQASTAEPKPDVRKPSPKPEPTPKPTNVDRAFVERLNKLTAEFKSRAEQARDADLAKVRRTFEKKWQEAKARLRKLKDTEQELEKERRRLRDRLERERRYLTRENDDDEWNYEDRRQRDRVNDAQRDLDESQRKLDRTERNYKEQRRALVELAARIKASRSAVSRRDTVRTQQVETARLKIENLVRSGRTPTAAEMKALFEKALAVD